MKKSRRNRNGGRARRAAVAALALVLAAAGCRNSSESAPAGLELFPSTVGAHGCTAADVVFSGGCLRACTVPLVLNVLQISDISQVVAAADAEVLYATGQGGQVVEIDVSGPAPVESELVAPGVIDVLLASFGVANPARISGVAVYDAELLLVADLTSNCFLAVDRVTPDTVFPFIGEPNEAPGFADGPAVGVPGASRFHLDRPSQLCPTAGANPLVFIADPGNHAIRAFQGGAVSTVAGTGAPFYRDGDLGAVGFDTPVGLTLTCGGRLLISETGAALLGGHRLRQLVLGLPTFFGLLGTVSTRAGDGMPATIGGSGELASLYAPLSPLKTSGDDTYWIDSGDGGLPDPAGILRRMTGAADEVDCPLYADCNAAVAAGGHFTPGGVHSLTRTPSGTLYVLDAAAAQLLEITP